MGKNSKYCLPKYVAFRLNVPAVSSRFFADLVVQQVVPMEKTAR